jgi:nitrogen fixation protein NifX
MSGDANSRDVALRIGLAARALPDIESAQLMSVLVKALGMPLSVEKLSSLTVRQLQEAADTLFDQTPLPAVKQAMDYLWGKQGVEVSDHDLPVVQPYAEGEMPGSIRVAVASNNGEKLDGHFGSCVRFLIYQISPDASRLIDIRSTLAAPDRSEDKNAYRAQLIADCDVLCVVSIGGPAAAKVIKQEIHPLKFPNGGEAETVVAELRQVLGSKPPPWLARIMGKPASERVRFELEEEEA